MSNVIRPALAMALAGATSAVAIDPSRMIVQRPAPALPMYDFDVPRSERRGHNGHSGSKRKAPSRAARKAKRLMSKAGRKANTRRGRHGKK